MEVLSPVSVAKMLLMALLLTMLIEGALASTVPNKNQNLTSPPNILLVKFWCKCMEAEDPSSNKPLRLTQSYCTNEIENEWPSSEATNKTNITEADILSFLESDGDVTFNCSDYKDYLEDETTGLGGIAITSIVIGCLIIISLICFGLYKKIHGSYDSLCPAFGNHSEIPTDVKVNDEEIDNNRTEI